MSRPGFGPVHFIKGIQLDTLIGIFIVVVLFGLYMLPSMVAQDRGHPHFLAIVVLNVLTGWTGWGWVAALVWSFMSTRRAPL